MEKKELGSLAAVFFSRGPALVLWLVVALALSSCATPTVQRAASAPGEDTAPAPATTSTPAGEVYGPTLQKGESTEQYGPVLQQIRPVVLVLGPGRARAFAYLGVLQELERAKISVSTIYGTEMGGLIGGLYALGGGVNHLEWRLLKIGPDDFQSSADRFGLFGAGEARMAKKSNQRLSKLIRSIFGTRKIEQCAIPLGLGVGGSLVTSGNLPQALAQSFLDYDLTTGVKRPFLVREAKRLGQGPVVVVDVLEDQESAGSWEELKEADLVIRPDLKGIGKEDFQLKTSIVLRGRNALSRVLQELKKLIGDVK